MRCRPFHGGAGQASATASCSAGLRPSSMCSSPLTRTSSTSRTSAGFRSPSPSSLSTTTESKPCTSRSPPSERPSIAPGGPGHRNHSVASPSPSPVYSARHQVGRAKLTRPPPPHPTGPGAQRCPQRKPTLQTRVNIGMRGPACSLRVYEVDPLVCPRCGARLRVIAVIQNPVQIRKILNHLGRTGRAPPGVDPTTLD